MTRNLLRAGALSCALLSTTAFCTQPALAQDAAANVSPPQEKLVVAPGGVDMRSGRYAYSQTDLSIGGETGGLAMTRTLAQPVMGHNNPFANFSHGFDILVSEKRIFVHENIYKHSPGMPDYQIEIAFGGKSETFRSEGSTGGFTQESRSGFAQLELSGTKASGASVYTLRTGDGTEAVFRPIGSGDCSSVLRCAYVAQVTQADGSRLDFEYDNAGNNATRLRAVTSNRGYALLLEYSGSLVVKACTLNLALGPKPANNVCPANALATATYGYDGNAGETRLASATDASGATWGFVNAPSSVAFVKPGQTTPWLTNIGGFHRDNDGLFHWIVTRQEFADGSLYTYNYDETPPVYGQVPSIAGGTYTDNLGNVTQVRYGFPIKPYDPRLGYGDVDPNEEEGPPSHIVHQVTPGPVEVIDPLGRTSKTDYCDPNAMANLPANYRHRCFVMPVPASTTSPGDVFTRMTWDIPSRNLLKTERFPNNNPTGIPIVRSSGYLCSPATIRYCNKPVSDTDARLAVTEYSYDPAHGGLTRKTLPAPSPGAPRPETRYEYAQRYARVSDGAGGHVPVAHPVWLLSATSTCRTSAATGNPASPCATAGDEVRTTYDYGPDSAPNNLQLRGTVVTADGQSLRTCTSYDAQGRAISATGTGAQLGQCQ
jgi:hypothetical protein